MSSAARPLDVVVTTKFVAQFDYKLMDVDRRLASRGVALTFRFFALGLIANMGL
jgi:hypothetical protein